MILTEERKQRFKEVVSRRQFDWTVILENVIDPHNVSAVLRTADSVGIREVFLLYTEEELKRDFIELGHNSSSGARKWVDVRLYTDTEACFAHVRRFYKTVLSTYLDDTTKSVYELDLTQPVALLFGNEHSGLSDEVMAHSDGNFLIPQMGMSQSLNISVACAVTLYEGMRQRQKAGLYQHNQRALPEQLSALELDYTQRHEYRHRGARAYRIK